MMTGISFRDDIQGLRAIAVIAVMVFHFNPAWLPGGFVGVDIFLVISGFLITNILIRKKEDPDYCLSATLKYFYVSRLKRIAPAYFCMLFFVTLLAAVLFLPQDFRIFKDGLERAAWFNSNSFFADFGDYFAPAIHEQPLLHTWSLAIEIQFYLLVPFLVLLLPVRLLKGILSLLLIGLTITAEYRLRNLGAEQATYYSLYARLPEFFAGALAALFALARNNGWKANSWLAVLGLILIAVSFACQLLLGHFPGLPALLPILGSVFLLIGGEGERASKFLSLPPFVWVGELSYSLYLWHWPVLAFLRYYNGSEVLSLQLSLFFVVLTMLLATASYYLVEVPLRIKKIPKTQVFGSVVILIAGLSASLSATKINDYLTPEQLPIEYQRYADSATICHGQMVDDCLQGDLNSDREILVLGDSHAAMLNLFFDHLGKELNFKARIITASSCVTIPGFDYPRLPSWAQESCINQIDEASRYIETASVVFMAGMWSYHVSGDGFISAVRVFWENIDQQKKQIYLMPQIILLNNNPLRFQRFQHLGLPTQLELDPASKQANAIMASLAKDYVNVSMLELDSRELFTHAPFYGEKLIYFDRDHLNEVGAILYARLSHNRFAVIRLDWQ